MGVIDFRRTFILIDKHQSIGEGVTIALNKLKLGRAGSRKIIDGDNVALYCQ